VAFLPTRGEGREAGFFMPHFPKLAASNFFESFKKFLQKFARPISKANSNMACPQVTNQNQGNPHSPFVPLIKEERAYLKPRHCSIKGALILGRKTSAGHVEASRRAEAAWGTR
jgi:hypothetical protein